MAGQLILKNIHKNVGILTINRPEKLNALNSEAYAQLNIAFKEMETNAAVRMIVITGSGKKAFCSGGDVAEESKLENADALEWFRMGQNLYHTIETSPKPVLAVINGYCLGGGFELALACDFRICVENAKLGAPEAKLGVACGFGGNIRLPRIIGTSRAKELMMSGRMIDAHEAERIGLVNMISSAETLEETVQTFCAGITDKSMVVLGLIKKVIDTTYDMNIDEAIEFDCEMATKGFSTADHHEGMTAFLEKRPPRFQDK